MMLSTVIPGRGWYKLASIPDTCIHHARSQNMGERSYFHLISMASLLLGCAAIYLRKNAVPPYSDGTKYNQLQ